VSAVSPARRAAARVLERVETDQAFADIALDAEIDRAGLSARDGALATELTLGVLRWRRYLDALLAPHCRRRIDRLDSRVLTLLRLTAYQLVCLERVPAWAAVNDAVALAKQREKPGVPEFVNAVLRAFARRGASEARSCRRTRSTPSRSAARFRRGLPPDGSSATAPRTPSA
jgi:16S rRNA (cytosine967-C5)-methyltransferase